MYLSVRDFNWVHAGIVAGLVFIVGAAFAIGATTMAADLLGWQFGAKIAQSVLLPGALGTIGGKAADIWTWADLAKASRSMAQVVELNHPSIVDIGVPDLTITAQPGLVIPHLDTYLSIFGENKSVLKSIYVSVNTTRLAGSGYKRELVDYEPDVVYVANAGTHNVTVVADARAVGNSFVALGQYLGLPVIQPNVTRRDGQGSWVSYNTLGYNSYLLEGFEQWLQQTYNTVSDTVQNYYVSKVQPCDNMPECFAYQLKGCMSLGDSNTPGVELAMVGEYYLDAFGGIDWPCQQG